MAFLDFAALKQAVSIDQVTTFLGLTMKEGNGQLRGPCIKCKSGGDRALAITPSKASFFCFAARKGGDVIALVAHIKDCGMKDAAQMIADHFTPSTAKPVQKPAAMQTLTYLEPDHEAIQKLGISGDTARAFESGYAPKGVLRGRYAVPVRDLRGQLLAYVGIAVSEEQSPTLLFHSFNPAGVIWNVENLTDGADLTVFSDPLHAIIAVENGIPINQVVSFLAPVTAQALVSLAALLDEKQIEAVEFH